MEQLEAGDLPLERSLALFERGQALAGRCAELLDTAELRVKTLTGENLTIGENEEEDR